MMPMRPISPEGFGSVAVATSFGPAPQLQWLPIADLVVDESYQRPLDTPTSRGNIRTIAGRFDWRFFAPVVVSPVVGGRFAVVDGQHRATAAALCGIETVPCLVIIADQREQAAAFGALNNQVTRVGNGQIFKAKLAAGDAIAAQVKACIERAGVRLLYSNQQASKIKPDQTYALNVITQLHASHGAETVTAALRAIRVSAGDCQGYLTSIIIKSVVQCLADHQAWVRHPKLDAAMANLDLVEERDRTQERARRHRSQTTSINLRLRVAEHLERELATPARAA